MPFTFRELSTGINELDQTLKGILPGDNLVWNIETIEDYMLFLEPYCRQSREAGQNLIYFRFANHQYLIKDEYPHQLHDLKPVLGNFESFITTIHSVLDKNGKGGFYVFDCLSELVNSWFSDYMLGNFFLLTCPYLLDIKALAYFPIIQNTHSLGAITPILETTQIFINIYRHNNDIYVHPIKVQQRYSPTIYMLHKWHNKTLTPVSQSIINAEIFTSRNWFEISSQLKARDIWTKTFAEAIDIIEKNELIPASDTRYEKIKKELIRMIISREDKISRLVEKYFTLKDLTSIGSRMIGTGLIGGKSVGMLLARAILSKNYPKYSEKIEIHDSFYIGSDVFYSYLIKNGCWWIIQQRDLDIYLHNAKHARRSINTGKFPEDILRKFSEMLDYFGQSPIIVRSSSLLEDNFGNAFSGKYESVFCPNQGPRDERLQDFINAVRQIYASSMNEDALRYRARRNMLEKEEQMSILVQRVSGSLNNALFYPVAAGVGYSYNQYVWHDSIEPESGFLRLVFGLGTRAVDRLDDDYTRLVALNAPGKSPEESIGKIRKYSQRKVDVIDLKSNQVVSMDYESVLKERSQKILSMTATRDYESEEKARTLNLKNFFSYVLTFEGLLEKSDFPSEMRDILKTIEKSYDHPVDVEFTVNFRDEDNYSIDILQCRPLETRKNIILRDLSSIDENSIIFRTSGPVIGRSREFKLDYLVYVYPSAYAEASLSEKYAVARSIGNILNKCNPDSEKSVMLVGPGRWGTTTPSLGIPVSFSEISKTSLLCEIVMMHENLIPDVSMGSHFFNDLVEFDILYSAIFPDKGNNLLNENIIKKLPDASITETDEEVIKLKHIIKVISFCHESNSSNIHVYADSLKQKAVCYLNE